MKHLFILLLLISCGKQKIQVELPKDDVKIEVDAPEKIEIEAPEKIEVEVSDSEHLLGFDFPGILNYCTGQIDHEIAECKKNKLGSVCGEIQSDREFLINDCFYDLDLSVLNNLSELGE